MANTITCTTTTGETLQLSLDTSAFGFPPGVVVHYTKSRWNGKVALVRGVHNGMLWFSVFPSVAEAHAESASAAPVMTTSCRGKEEYIRQYGWMIDSAEV